MKKFLLNKLCLIILFLMCHSAVAHNPDEIGYNFQLNNDKQELTIHFTPNSAVTLIKFLKPELEVEQIIKLENYLSFFESYFAETINFKINDEKVKFKLIESDLYSHDATLVFKLIINTQMYSNFEVTIDSYNSIYKRIKNIISVRIQGETFRSILDNKQKTYQASCTGVPNKSNLSIFHNTMGFSVLLLFGFIIYKFRKC